MSPSSRCCAFTIDSRRSAIDVEIAAELPNFVAALRELRRDTRAEISFGEFVCRRAKFQ